MRVQQLIVGCFKQAFHKMFGKQCRILHTSRIRKRRHTDPSCGTSFSFISTTAVNDTWLCRQLAVTSSSRHVSSVYHRALRVCPWPTARADETMARSGRRIQHAHTSDVIVVDVTGRQWAPLSRDQCETGFDQWRQRPGDAVQQRTVLPRRSGAARSRASQHTR